MFIKDINSHRTPADKIKRKNATRPSYHSRNPHIMPKFPTKSFMSPEIPREKVIVPIMHEMLSQEEDFSMASGPQNWLNFCPEKSNKQKAKSTKLPCVKTLKIKKQEFQVVCWRSRRISTWHVCRRWEDARLRVRRRIMKRSVSSSLWLTTFNESDERCMCAANKVHTQPKVKQILSKNVAQTKNLFRGATLKALPRHTNNKKSIWRKTFTWKEMKI